MALGGNRNTAYCHALFTYNQRVKCIGDRCGNKDSKTAPCKVVVRNFRTTTFCFTICMYWQLCRNHELHYANSSTSFHEFIYFIELTHTAAVAEGDDWVSSKSRMQWLMESNALAEGVECSGWRRRMQWPEETNAIAEGVECDSWRRHICTLLHKDSTLTVLNIQSRCYSTNNLPSLIIHRFTIAYSLTLLSSHLQYMYHSLDASQVLCHVTYGKHQSHRISVMPCRLIYVTYQLVALWYERFYSIIRNPT